MSRLYRIFTRPPIPNTGSVARDHLANERTFLSWTRTGLGFVALGVALAKLDALEALSPIARLSETQHPAPTHDLPLRGSPAENDGPSNLSDMEVPAAALVASGTGCLGYGTVRYYRSAMLLQKSSFRVNYLGVGLVAVTCAVVAAGGGLLVLREEKGR